MLRLLVVETQPLEKSCETIGAAAFTTMNGAFTSKSLILGRLQTASNPAAAS